MMEQAADQLTDGAVTLRPFNLGDVDEVYSAIQESGAQLSPWMPDLSTNLSRADITHWAQAGARAWAEGTTYNFAMTDAANGALLGGCGLNGISRGHRFANLYYWVRNSATRRGVATAATVLAARFAFKHVGLHRVEIVVAVGNEASLRVAEKAGAMREGVLRNRLTMRGQSHDAVMFSLIPEDLYPASQP